MTAIVILVAFLAGAAAGIAVLLRVGMASEDSRKPLVYEPRPARPWPPGAWSACTS